MADRNTQTTSLTEAFLSIQPRYPELVGKAALVTGSSMGIGKGIALRLAREGMHIVIHGKEEDRVAETVKEFETLGVNVLGVSADFSRPDAVDRLFDQIRKRHSHLSILVNNAADLRRAVFDDTSAELLDFQLTVNIRAPFLCAVQAKSMMDGQSGSIINISSVGGQRAHWLGLPYDMTKGALEAMTRAMALNLASQGIRVNAIAPGAIFNPDKLQRDESKLQEIIARIPLGRLGTSHDIAAMVAFLSSEEAGYITGQVYAIDGGIMAQLSPPGQPI